MNIFITSDSHFSHRGIVQFLRADGVTKERPWDTIEEMDEALVKNWNSVVRPTDKVIHLGDVVINRSALPIMDRLNGEKTLVLGNHDVLRIEEYLQYFKKVKSMQILDNFICTHIPIHEASLHRWKGNFHGHLHSNRVMTVDYRNGDMFEVIDPRYLCLSVEQTNFTPISLEDAKKRWEEQQ